MGVEAIRIVGLHAGTELRILPRRVRGTEPVMAGIFGAISQRVNSGRRCVHRIVATRIRLVEDWRPGYLPDQKRAVTRLNAPVKAMQAGVEGAGGSLERAELRI